MILGTLGNYMTLCENKAYLLYCYLPLTSLRLE